MQLLVDNAFGIRRGTAHFVQVFLGQNFGVFLGHVFDHVHKCCTVMLGQLEVMYHVAKGGTFADACNFGM